MAWLWKTELNEIVCLAALSLKMHSNFGGGEVPVNLRLPLKTAAMFDQ